MQIKSVKKDWLFSSDVIEVTDYTPEEPAELFYPGYPATIEARLLLNETFRKIKIKPIVNIVDTLDNKVAETVYLNGVYDCPVELENEVIQDYESSLINNYEPEGDYEISYL